MVVRYDLVLFRSRILILRSVAKFCLLAVVDWGALPKSVTTASLWVDIQDTAEYNFLAKQFSVFISVVCMSNDTCVT